MRKQSFLFVLALAGLVNGCGGGQTKPDDANSPQPRCGPQTRCGSVDDDKVPPPQGGQKIVLPEGSDREFE